MSGDMVSVCLYSSIFCLREFYSLCLPSTVFVSPTVAVNTVITETNVLHCIMQIGDTGKVMSARICHSLISANISENVWDNMYMVI